MNDLLLSSQRLSDQKVLATGSFDVLERLQKNRADSVHLEMQIPFVKLELEWKEVLTPATSASFKDLVGKKMAEYKFQYLGQFKYNGKVIGKVTEAFSSAFVDQNIQEQLSESNTWVNCTWLVDFLMNAQNKTNEKIILRLEGDQMVLALSTQATDGKSAEQQKYIFAANFETLAWEHHALFAG